MGRPFKCPYCKSERTVSKGTRVTKSLGPRRLRRCKACGRKFTPKHQKARVAGSHKPKGPLRRDPTVAKSSDASPSRPADEWWKLNEEAEAPQPADEAQPDSRL
jgi:hypothetical protein